MGSWVLWPGDREFLGVVFAHISGFFSLYVNSVTRMGHPHVCVTNALQFWSTWEESRSLEKSLGSEQRRVCLQVTFELWAITWHREQVQWLVGRPTWPVHRGAASLCEIFVRVRKRCSSAWWCGEEARELENIPSSGWRTPQDGIHRMTRNEGWFSVPGPLAWTFLNEPSGWIPTGLESPECRGWVRWTARYSEHARCYFLAALDHLVKAVSMRTRGAPVRVQASTYKLPLEAGKHPSPFLEREKTKAAPPPSPDDGLLTSLCRKNQVWAYLSVSWVSTFSR